MSAKRNGGRPRCQIELRPVLSCHVRQFFVVSIIALSACNVIREMCLLVCVINLTITGRSMCSLSHTLHSLVSVSVRLRAEKKLCQTICFPASLNISLQSRCNDTHIPNVEIVDYTVREKIRIKRFMHGFAESPRCH